MAFKIRLFFVALLCAFAGFFPARAQNFSVKPADGGLIISWENLRCLLPVERGSTRAMLSAKYAFSELGVALPAAQCLRFIVAVPGDGKHAVYLRSIHTRNAGKIRLACSFLPSADACAAGSFSPRAEIRFIGNRRGVPLAEVLVQPFGYDAGTGALTLAENGAVNICFDGKSGAPLTWEIADRALYRDVLNPSQITSKRGAIKKSGEKILAPDEWYNPETTYLRLTTKRDGVALFTGADIIAANPSWNGRPTANLTLLHNGQPYPFAALDPDGVISSADSFYFAGRRTAGDTTFIDYVTGEEPFFLTLDARQQTARLQQMSALQAEDSIRTVNLALHLEQDLAFSWGDIIGSPGTSSYNSEIFSTGKGFYWKALLSYPSPNYNALRTSCILLPSRNPDEVLTVTSKYYTHTDDTATEIDYNVRLNVNGSTAAEQEADGHNYYRITAALPSASLFSGENSLSLINQLLQADKTTALDVDYFTVSGLVRPLAVRGVANFSVPLRAAPSTLSVPGFSQRNAVAIDTASRKYAVIQGIAGTFATAGAGVGELSVTVNDTASSSAESGLLLAAALPDGTTSIRFFEVNSSDASAFLNGLPDSTGVAAAFRSGEALPSQIRNFFTSQGAKADVPAGTGWACIVRKNIAGTVREQTSDAVASVDNFYAHPGGRNFRADVVLPAGDELPVIICDSEAIERVFPALLAPSRLRNKPANADVIIVTHPDFEQAAGRLSAYRRTQGYSVEVVNVENTYTEFNFGKKSPFAIKRYLQFLTAQNGKSPAYLVLFGDASWDPRRLQPNANQTDFVPSYGFPVTDFWYGLMDNDNEYDIIVGRLPAHTPEDADGVVDKLIEYDSLAARPWMRKFLFLSGGEDAAQQEQFYNFFEAARETVLNLPVCIDTARLRRNPDGMVDHTLAISVRNAINEGVAWMNFWGHGAPEVFEVDGWQVNTLTNRSKYNVLTTFSCSTGAFANPYSECRNEGYVMAPDRGSIASFGNTSTGVVPIDFFVSYNLFQAMRDGARLLGEILYTAKGGMGHNPEYRVAQQQFCLIGDPLTRFVLDSIPDLYILDSDIKIEAPDGSAQISESDSVARVRVFVRNVGTHLDSAATVRLIRRYNNKSDTLATTVQYICAGGEVVFYLGISGKPGRHDFTVEIDPEHNIPEGNRGTNVYTTSFDVLTGGVQALDPLPMWDVAASRPAFRFVRPEVNVPLRFECELWNDAMSEKLGSSAATESTGDMTVHEAYVEWQPKGIPLVPGANYTIRARTVNTATSYPSGWLIIPFHASDSMRAGVSSWRQGGVLPWSGTELQTISGDASGGLTLGSKHIPVSSFAAGGGPGVRYSRIIVGRQEYIEKPDMSNFNIVHLTPFDSAGKYRDYAGWRSAHEPVARMGNSDSIVFYLRDSVKPGDYVIISVSDGGFNGFLNTQKGVVGDVTSFVEVMRTFGSVLVDTAFYGKFYPDGKPILPDHIHATTYAMIGVKGGAIGSPREICAWRNDTVGIFDSIVYIEKRGKATSPLIGPAAAWHSTSFRLSISDSGAAGGIRVVGRKSGTGEDTVLAEANSSGIVHLGSISAQEFPYLQITGTLERTRPDANPTLQSWGMDFTPAPEFALLKNTTLTPDSVLRGESAEYAFTVKNIARRVSADSGSVLVSAVPELGAGSAQEILLPLQALAPDEEKTLNTTVQSRYAGAITGITTIANPAVSVNELYRFNNKRQTVLTIGEDGVKPSIEVLADGRPIVSGDVVAPETQLDIVIHDNSLLPVDSANLRVRLNRFIQPDTNARNATFTQLTGAGTARARLSFLSRKTLEIGDNILSVIAEDATANRDTLRMTLSVVLNGSVGNIAVKPNPITTSGEIFYDYKGRVQDASVTIRIFNLTGREVRTLTDAARIGNNATTWDGRDNNGDDVPPGLYVFVLNISTDSYIEPQTGRLLIVR